MTDQVNNDNRLPLRVSRRRKYYRRLVVSNSDFEIEVKPTGRGTSKIVNPIITLEEYRRRFNRQ